MVTRRGSRLPPFLLGTSLLLNGVFLATYLARQHGAQPSELVQRMADAPSAAGRILQKEEGTTQLADMYTAPLHLVKNLIDKALTGAGYGAKRSTPRAKTVTKRQLAGPLADADAASLNTEVTDHKVVDSTGAFFDPSIKGFVNPLLLPHLAEMNALQAKVLTHKRLELQRADSQIAAPTSGGKMVAKEEPVLTGLFQWGSVNPVNHVMRLDCADTVMDASSNGARMSRLWGSRHTKSELVDACGPGDECRDSCAYEICNKHASYTVECPPGCAARAGPVFGGGSAGNPFLDASSVCGAALAQGISRNDAPTLLTLKIVEPVQKYHGSVQPVSKRYSGDALQALKLLGDVEGAAVRTTLDFEWYEWERAADPTEVQKLSGPRFTCCKGEV